MNTLSKTGILAVLLYVLSTPTFAQNHNHHAMHLQGGTSSGHNHSATAPIGVMGAHMHKKGNWMLSYRYNRMKMNGNRNGTNDLSPTETITFPNPHLPPAMLRVVPTEMTMEMHMIGGMVGITDWLTLMAMTMYMENSMSHITFNASGVQIGTFNTKSRGWGDTSITSLIRLYEDKTNHIHLNAGLSLPTGSIDETDDVLAPTGMTPTLRLPYAMQLGSGTYDLLPGITYIGTQKPWSWGTQYNGAIRLENNNNENYSLGNRHALTAWGGYQFSPWFQGNIRINAETLDKINGNDPLITAPVQTADPDNYGGKHIEANIGFNINAASLGFKGAEIGGEITIPVYQNLNGPQLKRDWSAVIGLSYSF